MSVDGGGPHRSRPGSGHSFESDDSETAVWCRPATPDVGFRIRSRPTAANPTPIPAVHDGTRVVDMDGDMDFQEIVTEKSLVSRRCTRVNGCCAASCA
jgi:hypothetical protein